MEARSIKEAARRLIEQLPENSTWDDLMYEIYMRQAVEAGLADSQAGRGLSVEEVRKRFGLPLADTITDCLSNEPRSALTADA